MRKHPLVAVALMLFGTFGVPSCRRPSPLQGNGITLTVGPTTAVRSPGARPIEGARDMARAFIHVAEELSPSVVQVTTLTASRSPFANPFKGTPFERFFDDDYEEDGDNAPHFTPKRLGMGSGVVIDHAGHVLTNDHVVEGADEVRVTFVDGRSVNGKVVGLDPRSDLAVVKVEATGLVPVRFGDSEKAVVGEWVVAIGNPFGLDHSVTVGVLSAKNRSGFRSGHYEDFLQTDASINPGNSGGPLVSLDGEVIGINSMIAGLGTGIGFAVPSSIARPVAEQLIAHGKVSRAYLGVLMQVVTPDLRKALGNDAPTTGALVAQVEPNSPADKAGIRPGDVVINIDGVAVRNPRDIQRHVLSKKAGDKVRVHLWRKGKELDLFAELTDLPGEKRKRASLLDPPDDPPHPLGMQLQTLNADLAREWQQSGELRGVIVTRVRLGSPASLAGLFEGDVLTDVDHERVTRAVDAEKLLKEARPSGHLLRVVRGTTAVYLVLRKS